MKAVIALVTLLTIFGGSAGEGKKWALLIAGTKDFESYSLEAGVCHAYQVLHEYGIPDENIVVMMYDDIAYNERNPVQGEVLNYPDGPNVYPGVPHDYVNTDVNTEVFLAVLQGDRDRVYELTGYHGKVVDSGPEDHVFVFLASLGAPGFMGMPEEPNLYASELNKALQSMYDNSRFANLVFYVEGSYSGSMFEEILPDTINVYALTASTHNQTASPKYYDDLRRVYLGGYFACAWLENCDKEDMTVETLEEQYEIVVEKVTKSTPTQYGDLSFTSWPVSEFVGNGKPLLRQESRQETPSQHPAITVAMEDVEIFTLKHRLSDPREKNHEEEIKAELEEKVWLKAQTEVFFSSLVSHVFPNEDVGFVLNTHSAIKQRSAYEYAVGYLMDVCPRLRSSNRFVFGKMNALVNLTNCRSLKQVIAAVETVAIASPLCHK